VINRLK